MRTSAFAPLSALGLSAILALAACGSDPSPTTGSGGSGGGSSSTGHGGEHSHTGGSSSSGTGGSAPSTKALGYYFSADPAANKWIVTVVDPTAATPLVTTLALDDLAALTGPVGNSKGPAWGDPVVS